LSGVAHYHLVVNVVVVVVVVLLFLRIIIWLLVVVVAVAVVSVCLLLIGCVRFDIANQYWALVCMCALWGGVFVAAQLLQS
jgi:hypothetical protein